jgi:uncharacterized membrane protein YeaQ/YmgE (transglycosylase-associated protein family)
VTRKIAHADARRVSCLRVEINNALKAPTPCGCGRVGEPFDDLRLYSFRLIFETERPMEEAGIGWIAAIIIGGIAGWLAEKITRSNMGLITNIILGVIGAGIASWLFGLLGLRIGGPGWIGYLVAGFVGACILILLTRMLYPARWRA